MLKVIPNGPARNEEGFILVLTLITLLLLTLYGIWALNSADFENRVAGNMQQAERVFNVNDGANSAENSKLVNGRRAWFVINNPDSKYQVMLPNSPEAFDPFDSNRADDDALDKAMKIAGGDEAEIKSLPEYWPWDNLVGDYGSAPVGGNQDYRYLVTYLYWDTAPQGEDAVSGGGGSSSFKFRVQAGAPGQNGIVETGGIAVGGAVE